MTLAWIAYGLVVGALLAATAAAAEHLLRLARRPARWVWIAALVATAALVLTAPARFADAPAASGPAGVELREAGASLPRHAPSRFEALVAGVAGVRVAASIALERALAGIGGGAPRWLERLLGGAWLLASGAMLLVLVTVYWRFSRQRRWWPRIRLHDTPVRVAPHAGPAVIGLAEPEIVVPRWLLERSAEEQRLVLAHEREHVAAKDPIVLAAGCAIAALLPWHPAVWWMLSRMRLAVELDCDARVLRQGVAPRSYGTLLIDLAGQCSGFRVGAPALADESSHLEQRLLAMKPQLRRHVTLRAAAFGGAALLALLAACEAKLPTATEVADMNVAGAESGARKIALMSPDDTAARYTVDGVAVSAAEARAISPEKIASIEVSKVALGSGQTSTVAITTRKPGDPASGHNVLVRMNPNGSVVAGPQGEMKVRKFDGIVFVDGVRVSHAAMNSIPPADIVSVEVVKGPEAAKLYEGPEAANGVIRITTKKGAAKK